jgi:hypothetical protein
MKDIELECLPAWRYCQVREGEKVPFPAGWQSNPLQLTQIMTNNLGVLLGPKSAGVVALDFDGATAWTWFEETFGIDVLEQIIDTVAWTSGKDFRCQMAFSVPEDYWPLLRTQKIPTGDHEGFEFRWDRTQSILPPSRLADGRQYTWINSPSTTDLLALPENILIWWVLKCNPEPVKATTIYSPTTVDGDEVVAIYEELKRHYPVLGWDMWAKATWAACRTLGRSDGVAVMKTFWPEQQEGEYNNLLTTKTEPAKPVTLGTVITWIRRRDPNFNRAPIARKSISIKGNYYQEQIAQEIAILENEIMRRKQNG